MKQIWKRMKATGVAAMSAGASHSFYLTTDGKLYATGYNGDGQLGLGDTTNRTSWTLTAS